MKKAATGINSYLKEKAGFTLIEVLVAMFVGLIIAAMLFVVLEQQGRKHTAQTEITRVQQKLISTIDLVGKEIRLAGYLDNQDRISWANQFSITFRADIDHDAPLTVILEGTNTSFYLETVTYYFENPTVTDEASPLAATDPLRHNGTLVRYQVGDGATEGRIIADNLDEVSFEYYDIDGAPIGNPDVGYDNLIGDDGRKYRDAIRRVRIKVSDSTTSAAASTSQITGANAEEIKTRSRTLVREVAPPNLAVEPLMECGGWNVEISPLQISACEPCNDYTVIRVKTYELDADGANILTNKNNIFIDTTPASSLYNDPGLDPLNEIFSPLVGGSRNESSIIYVKSGTITAGAFVEVKISWKPADDDSCPTWRTQKNIEINACDACVITLEEPVDPFAHICGTPESIICPTDEEFVFKLRDACGNPVGNGPMNFEIHENDASGTKGGLFNLTDDPDKSGDPRTDMVEELSDDDDLRHGFGTVPLVYRAPVPSSLTSVTLVGTVPDHPNLATCNAGLSKPIALLPCIPDDIDVRISPNTLVGCMNTHYTATAHVLDMCDNEISGLEGVNAQLISETEPGESVSEYESPPYSIINPAPPSSVTNANEISTGTYQFLYNTRTDIQDVAPRPIRIDVYYTDKIASPEINIGPATIRKNLQSCDCILYDVYLPEYFCDIRGGISFACPEFAWLIAQGGGDMPNNYGKIEVEMPSGQVNLYLGPDVDNLNGPFPDLTEEFTWEESYQFNVWMNNLDAAIGTPIRLMLKEYSAEPANELQCQYDYYTQVLCSDGEIELMDSSGQYPAITYDPYDEDEKIFIELRDCNFPAPDVGFSTEVTLFSTQGDIETVKLYADMSDQTLYKNPTGIKITALERPTKGNGVLEVSSSDKIWVDWKDPTVECCDDYAHDEVDLMSFCIPAALYSGAGASFSGTAFRIHWGEVIVFDDIDFSGQFDKKVVSKNRSMAVEDTADPYVGNSQEDRWVDMYIGGIIQDIDSIDTQQLVDKGFENIYQNVPVSDLECIMPTLDYEAVKDFAIRNDVYYYSLGDSSIMRLNSDGSLDGPLNFHDTVLDDSRHFMFVDIINAPSNDLTGDEIDALPLDSPLFATHRMNGSTYYRGTLYVAGHLDVSGLGSGTTIQAETPPINDIEQVMFPPLGEGTYADLPVHPDTDGSPGQMVSLDVHIEGILYLEGNIDITGNLNIFGSIAAEGGYSGTGNPEVWYNYKSGRGCGQNQCCRLKISPANPEVMPGGSIQFTASGGTEGDVEWDFITNTSGATITSDTGLYIAGSSIGKVDKIEAVDVGGCNPGTTTVTIICPSISITGASEVRIGKKKRYTASGGTEPYTWTVNFAGMFATIASISSDASELTGVALGAVVITATDANGCTGNYSVAITNAPAVCEKIYFNDFDGNEEGFFTSSWDSCTLPGGCDTQDDWQFGDPDGDCNDPNSGSSLPGGSGGDVMANDLGASGWNGCYGGNVFNYVISPAIETTGYENIEISYASWVTVANDDYARFKICCAGGCDSMADYWLASEVDSYSDTSWQSNFFPVPLGYCDDKAETYYLFELDTTRYTHSGGWNVDDFYICGYPISP